MTSSVDCYIEGLLRHSFISFRRLSDHPGYGADTEGQVWSSLIGGEWRPLSATGTRYLHVGLMTGGVRRHISVHKIILDTFIGPCPQGKEACHNNGNGMDNRLENLRWGTPVENMDDQYLHGTRIMGESHGRSKLKEADVLRVKSLLAEGRTKKSIAREYGVRDGTIRHIAMGWSWKHLETGTDA